MLKLQGSCLGKITTQKQLKYVNTFSEVKLHFSINRVLTKVLLILTNMCPCTMPSIQIDTILHFSTFLT